MIITGAEYISQLLNTCTLQVLSISFNNIGDNGISAIAKVLGISNINKLSVCGCDITLTGVKSLALALSSNHTIRKLWLYSNPITVEGALLIVRSAVHSTVCQRVFIDDEYENNEVKKMMSILEHRSEV